MKTQNASAVLWDRSNAKINAENGMGNPADAFTPPVPVHKLIKTINSDPESLGRLAARKGEMTEAQRTRALRAYKGPPEAPKAARKAAKVEPKSPPNFKGLSAVRLGFGRGARS